MTTEETITRLKQWLHVVGLGRIAAQIDGWLDICEREDFDELVARRSNDEG